MRYKQSDDLSEPVLIHVPVWPDWQSSEEAMAFAIHVLSARDEAPSILVSKV